MSKNIRVVYARRVILEAVSEEFMNNRTTAIELIWK